MCIRDSARTRFLASVPFPQGRNTVIITNGGGIGVLAADACEDHKVKLYDNLTDLKKTFSPIVPRFGSVKNPIDITGQAGVKEYEQALDAAIRNESIHSIICLGCETAVLNVDRLAPLLERTSKEVRKTKPIVFSFLGGKKVRENIHSLSQRNIPIFSDVEEAVSCLGAVYFNYRYKKTSKTSFCKVDIDLEKIKEVVSGVRKAKRSFFLASQAVEVMKAAGIPTPKSYVAKSEKEALILAKKVGFPLVMKIVSEDIIHKSEAGGVILNVRNQEEVKQTYRKIRKNCRYYNAEAKLQGVEICEMIETGLETIIGARKDEVFGPIVVFGLGGIYVETIKDVVFRALPISYQEAKKMVKEVKSSSLFQGIRGEKSKDVDSIVDALIKISAIIQESKDIQEIEINPLIVYEKGKGVKALDTRILL